MINDLSSIDWNYLYNSDNVEFCYDKFINTFLNSYNGCIPLKSVHIKNNKIKIFITNKIKNAINKKNKLYKIFLNNKTDRNWDIYNSIKKQLKYTIKKEKNISQNYLTNLTTCINDKWKLLNKLTHNKFCLDKINNFVNKNNDAIDSTNVGNEFNIHFDSMGKHINNSFENLYIENNLINSNINSIYINETSELEIITIINKIDSKCSKDHDGIDFKLIKLVIYPILKPLLHIFNLILNKSIYPSNMKKSVIIPIHKNNNKNNIENYRPISIIPQFSKIIEKIIIKRINNFIEKNNIISSNQYGFKKKSNTLHTIYALINNITNSIDKHDKIAAVFVDIKKAFDTIDHKILFIKLYKYGIRGQTLNLIKSYLYNKKQSVRYNDKVSPLITVYDVGLPQGSILGPLLFMLYINDISNLFINYSIDTKLILYADDTSITINNANNSKINENLKILSNWFINNKLQLNISKRKVMYFYSNTSITNTNEIITLNNQTIHCVNQYKFLGLYIDNKLNYKKHIIELKIKLAKIFYLFKKNSFLIDTKTLLLLYNALIVPNYMYCLIIWGINYKSNINKLFIQQKKIIRLINKTPNRIHNTYKLHNTDLLFKKFLILNIYDLINYISLNFMHNVFNKKLPINITNKFEYKINNYNIRNKCNYRIPKYKTNNKLHTINVYGIKLWNELNNTCKNLKYNAFKKYIKLEYLNKY